MVGHGCQRIRSPSSAGSMARTRSTEPELRSPMKDARSTRVRSEVANRLPSKVWPSNVL